MVVGISAISKDNRKKLEKLFKKPRKGSNLQSVINEVLNDKDIFAFMAAFSERGQGLLMGNMTFWDDIRVIVSYGLVLDVDYVPRKLKLFTYETFGYTPASISEQKHFRLSSSFPDYDKQFSSDFCGFPSPEEFALQADTALKNPEEHYVKLELDKR